MLVCAQFVGGPLDGQSMEIDNNRLLKWYILTYQRKMADLDSWPDLYDLQYELIGGIYYFVSDSEGARIWEKDKIEDDEE